MTVTFLGVRHHSPACARLAVSVIESLNPAFVLIEGPSDFNERLDELLLGHDLPIAIFSHHRGHRSWTPLCEYSPEWAALTAGHACGAEVRFIDLPAWHPAFAERSNRYADAEVRYAEATDRLCREFAVDNIDALWDRLFEIELDDGLAGRLSTYFALIRGDSAASDGDAVREQYMAEWIQAAVAEAGDRPVVVLTGGFHSPALQSLVELPTAPALAPGPTPSWPAVPQPAEDAVAGSYLVPYSFQRLDAFTGYQSGMPSPEYYQLLWERGPQEAAAALVETIATRLRKRGQSASTADLIAARAMADGLAGLRGHPRLARTDLLDGLVSALVSEDLDQPLPWSRRSAPGPGAHPVVQEMVTALCGERVGRLHPATPVPPLVRDFDRELTAAGLTADATVNLDLAKPDGLARSRVLHRLRVLQIPGFVRESGPSGGSDPVFTESWSVRPIAAEDLRRTALIEAGAYGASLEDAALAALEEACSNADNDVQKLADILFDAVLSGLTELSGTVVGLIADGVSGAQQLGALGPVLETVLGLWRHDRIFGTARDPRSGIVIDALTTRILWLAEGLHGGPAPADLPRLHALAAARDALLYASPMLTINRETALAIALRISADTAAPPDLRGAAFGFGWSLRTDDKTTDIDAGIDTATERALRGAYAPDTLGDWLTGLFALNREVGPGQLNVLDDLIAAMNETEFLIALPALRQAFAFFPPREREQIAQRLLDRRGVQGSARALLRTTIDPLHLAAAAELENRVQTLLRREGLLATGGPT